MISIRGKIKLLYQKGFFHIFGTNIINKVIVFFTNIVIVRFLSKNDYGIFSYASNLYSIALLFSGLGLLSAVLQFCTETQGKREQADYYKFALTRGLWIDAGITIILFSIGLFGPLAIEKSGIYLVLFAPLLLLDYVFQYISICLRTERQNQLFAGLQSLNTFSYFLFGCLGAYLAGIPGTIFGRYLAYLISISYGCLKLRRINFSLSNSKKLSKKQRKHVWAYAIPTGLSSVMLQLTYLVDVFVVGLFLDDPAIVAEYKISTMLPEGFLFIPASIIMFVLPYFIDHKNDPNWFFLKTMQLLVIIEIAIIPICLVLIIFAPAVISLLWGDSYLSAVVPFRILSISLFISPLRSVCVNLLATLQMVKSNFVISVVTLVSNVLLVVFLTAHYGVIGSALAVLGASGLAAGASLFCIIKKLKEARTRERSTCDSNNS